MLSRYHPALRAAGAALLLACCKAEATSEAPKSLPSVSFAAELESVALPKSSYAGPTAEATARVLLSKRYLLLNGDGFPILALSPERPLGKAGLPSEHKRSGPDDLLIAPLRQSLEYARTHTGAEPAPKAATAARFVLVADRATPYRAVVEILFTARQASYEDLRIAVAGPQGVTAIPLSSVPIVAEPDPAPLRALITADGIALQTSAGAIVSGCERVGSGVAVPNRSGAYDWAALGDCLRKLKEESELARTSRIVLYAMPEIDLQTIVRAMDVARERFGELAVGVVK